MYCYLTVNTRPLLSDLKEYFTPQYAADWKEIGIILGLDPAILANIKGNYNRSVTDCCNAMLNKWLKIDNTASWGKLLTVVESPPISTATDKGDYTVVYISSQMIKVAKYMFAHVRTNAYCISYKIYICMHIM